MNTCKAITELISQGNEQKLTVFQLGAIRFHLLFCPYCRAFDKNTRQIRQLMHAFKQREEND